MVMLLVSALISATLSAIVGPLLREEFQTRAPDWALNIVWNAAQRLPEDRRDRYFEEWCAHLDAARTPLAKFLASLGFSFASVRMSVEVEGTERIKTLSSDFGMRAVDIVGAMGMLVFMMPALLALTLAIYISDPGPVLFRHRRIGRGGRPIHVYKLRTMALDGNERLLALLSSDPAARDEWNRDRRLKRDPRITPIGRFLRSTSFDEIPQLLNVLGGSMSFVGPRPITAAEAMGYGKSLRSYQAVRPGVTGMSQLFGRSDPYYHRRKIALDRLYARKRSFKLYVYLLLATIPAVFSRPE